MYLCSLKFFITGFILIVSSSCVKSECIESKAACTCIRADGQGYDLTSLEHESPIISMLHNFAFQPCKNANLTFNVSNISECHSSSVCMLNGRNQSIKLGAIEESQWQVHPNDVHLVFAHGIHMTKISLVCCTECKMSTLYVDSSADPNYNLVFTSRRSCLIEMRPKGLSTGSVLVILFVVFSGLYFGCGALALKFFRGSVGWELIPNYDFWSDLPALVRDGVTFTLSGCTAGSYQTI